MRIPPPGQVANLYPKQMERHIFDRLTRARARPLPCVRGKAAQQAEQRIEDLWKEVNHENRLRRLHDQCPFHSDGR